MTMAAGIDVGTAAVKAVLFRPSETRRSDGGVSVHRKGQLIEAHITCNALNQVATIPNLGR